MTDWVNVSIEIDEEVKSSMETDAQEEIEEIKSIVGGGEEIIADTPTIQTGRIKDIDSTAMEIFKECPSIHRILFIRLSDSTHAGDGILYERYSGKVDSWGGYEGAKGNDVVGYFRDEHHIKGSSEDIY